MSDVTQEKPDREEAELRLERRNDGQLWAVLADKETPVWVRRCFPWTSPARFV